MPLPPQNICSWIILSVLHHQFSLPVGSAGSCSPHVERCGRGGGEGEGGRGERRKEGKKTSLCYTFASIFCSIFMLPSTARFLQRIVCNSQSSPDWVHQSTLFDTIDGFLLLETFSSVAQGYFCLASFFSHMASTSHFRCWFPQPLQTPCCPAPRPVLFLICTDSLGDLCFKDHICQDDFPSLFPAQILIPKCRSQLLDSYHMDIQRSLSDLKG